MLGQGIEHPRTNVSRCFPSGRGADCISHFVREYRLEGLEHSATSQFLLCSFGHHRIVIVHPAMLLLLGPLAAPLNAPLDWTKDGALRTCLRFQPSDSLSSLPSLISDSDPVLMMTLFFFLALRSCHKKMEFTMMRPFHGNL